MPQNRIRSRSSARTGAGSAKTRRTVSRTLQQLLDHNRAWAEARRRDDPDFFARLTAQQTPKFLWIGCSDSRVPPNELVGLSPGELFVHRNVANVVVHTDLNCLSVLQFAVEVLQVEQVIVCGHYGCSGIRAAMQNKQLGLIDNWLRNVRDVHAANRERIDRLATDEERGRLLAELNVAHQAYNVCHTTIVQNAWQRGQRLEVHAWCYDVADGLLRELGLRLDSDAQIDQAYRVTGEPPTTSVKTAD